MIEWLASILGPALIRLAASERLKKERKNLKYCEKTLIYTLKEQENLKNREMYLLDQIAEAKVRLLQMSPMGRQRLSAEWEVTLCHAGSGMTSEAS